MKLSSSSLHKIIKQKYFTQLGFSIKKYSFTAFQRNAVIFPYVFFLSGYSCLQVNQDNTSQ